MAGTGRLRLSRNPSPIFRSPPPLTGLNSISWNTFLTTVYFIQMDSPDRPIKVGKTDVAIEQRAKALRTGSPYRLEVLGTIEESGYLTERGIHAALHEYRMEGEWFRSSPEVLRFIRHLLSGTSGPYQPLDWMFVECLCRESHSYREMAMQIRVSADNLIKQWHAGWLMAQELSDAIASRGGYVRHELYTWNIARKSLRDDLSSLLKIDWRQANVVLSDDAFDLNCALAAVDEMAFKVVMDCVKAGTKVRTVDGTFSEKALTDWKSWFARHLNTCLAKAVVPTVNSSTCTDIELLD